MNKEREGGGRRRLIAGLRITRQDEALLDAVRSLFPEADTEGELAYRLWRRGLGLTLAEAVGLGIGMTPGIMDEQIATLVAQQLLLCLPLLRRMGMLLLLELVPLSSSRLFTVPPDKPAGIDTAAAATITGMGGGGEFL